MNGGFGLVLNGENSATAQSLLLWDVNNGIARRYNKDTNQYMQHVC